MKFSGSFNNFGDSKTTLTSKVNSTIKPVTSLVEK